jgi:hypothetical protein
MAAEDGGGCGGGADAVANVVLQIATDRALAGRILVWSSEDDRPCHIRWADQGYSDAEFGWSGPKS